MGATHIVWSRIETFFNINPQDINLTFHVQKIIMRVNLEGFLLVKFIFSLHVYPLETFLCLGMSTQFISSIVIGVLWLYFVGKISFLNQSNFMFCTNYFNWIYDIST